ncbi:MAG: hypothetical protein HQ548_02080 [Chloroflexi bacterium]|nr:hypothetical protein [Chloroflexota bacterium]
MDALCWWASGVVWVAGVFELPSEEVWAAPLAWLPAQPSVHARPPTVRAWLIAC